MDKQEIIQVINTGNEFEVADRMNSESPEWPVQDQGGHWHYEQFEGQRVVFRGAGVFFGFECEEVAEEDVPRDADGELNLNDMYRCNDGRFYRPL